MQPPDQPQVQTGVQRPRELHSIAELRAMTSGALVAVVIDALVEAHRGVGPDEPTRTVRFASDVADDWEPPADALARLAGRLGPEGSRRLGRTLVDVIALARPDRLPAAVLEDVLFATGLLQASQVLPAAARAVIDLADGWARDADRLQVVLLMVIKGMRGASDATDAARVLLGSPDLQPRFALDALEVLLADPGMPMEEALDEASARMSLMMWPSKRPRFESRLRALARSAIAPRPLPDVARALEVLLGEARGHDTGHPLGLLVRILLCEPDSPFRGERTGRGARLVRRADGASVAWRVADAAADAFLQPQAAFRAVARSPLVHQSDWASEEGAVF